MAVSGDENDRVASQQRPPIPVGSDVGRLSPATISITMANRDRNRPADNEDPLTIDSATSTNRGSPDPYVSQTMTTRTAIDGRSRARHRDTWTPPTVTTVGETAR